MRALFTSLLFTAALSAAPPLSEPALSPNHSEIAFVSGGDIWTVPAAGGEARLLISHPATESRPLYSPDGTRLAFNSTRTGNGDIYVLNLKSGELRRITFDDSRAGLDAWSADGKYLFFSSNRANIGMNDIYKVPATGGTPVIVTSEPYADQSQGTPRPSSEAIAVVNGNMAVTQWWRKGHAHIDETRITLVTPGAPAPTFNTLLDNHAKNLWPMWSADGRELYFMSDKSGVENIWKLMPGPSAAPKQVTTFTDGRVIYPAISADGKEIVFERDFKIWKLDTATSKTSPVEITLRGVPSGPSANHLNLSTEFSELRLSKDGKKLAFTAHGEVFAASAKDAGNASRITRTAAREIDPAWAPDNRRIVYASDRGGTQHLYLYDLTTEQETPLTSANLVDDKPAWSPDGKQLAWIRDGRELHIMTVDNKQDRVLSSKKFRTLSDSQNPLSWSPDGQWIALFDSDARGFSNVSVVPAAGGAERQISFIANSFGGSIVWSPDRTYLLFDSGQRTEQRAINRIDLTPRTPHFQEDQFRNLFAPDSQPATPATANPEEKLAPAKSPIPLPVKITFEGIRERLTHIPLGLDARSEIISPDGKTLLFLASSAGQENIYTYSLDELARQAPVARQLTSTPGRKSSPQFTPDGKEVYFLEGGRVSIVPLDTRVIRPLAITAELDTDFDQEKIEVFNEAWRTLNEVYYDPKFHGTNWAADREHYASVAAEARTPDEVRRVISIMIGEMNSSHSGINAGPAAAHQPTTGQLGIIVDPSDYTIRHVTPLGPADIAGIKAGEKLLAIDGADLTASTSIDELLQYKIGKRTLLRTSASQKDVPVLPVNNVTLRHLIYREWVEGRRAYVDKISKGKLGYVHMIDMSAQSLDQLYTDLDAENQSRAGVIVDIRNNTGGFVNAYALDVFARRPYLTMTEREHGSTPARSALGQRALELPTVLVVNKNSLSDAEDFTEGYRTLKLGKVVGEPTAGWIIFTGGVNLIDGSALRTPETRITANDGTDMELHPRPVDIEVPSQPGESFSGKDAQLDAAVKTLLGSL